MCCIQQGIHGVNTRALLYVQVHIRHFASAIAAAGNTLE